MRKVRPIFAHGDGRNSEKSRQVTPSRAKSRQNCVIPVVHGDMSRDIIRIDYRTSALISPHGRQAIPTMRYGGSSMPPILQD